MRILHTADLHIGKVVNSFHMLEEQKCVLTQMVDMVKANNVQVFIIAGDVYDRPIPSAEAVSRRANGSPISARILTAFITCAAEVRISVAAMKK